MSNYEKVKEWRKNNPEKMLRQSRRYRKKNPDTNKKAKIKYRAANLEKIRESDKLNQEKRRKADPEGYRRSYESWRNWKEAKLWDIAGRPRSEKCEICLELGMTVFDHCHNAGHFR